MNTFKKQLWLWSFAIFLASGIIASCNLSAGCGDVAPETNMLTGEINAYDVRDCACCGGWYLQTADMIFNFDELPAGSTIQLDESKLPIKVKFNYTEVPNACNDKGLKVVLTALELQ